MTRLQLFWRDFKFFDTTWPFWHDINFFGMTSTFLARLQLFWRDFNFFGTTSPFWHDFNSFGMTSPFRHDFNFFGTTSTFFGTTSTFLARLQRFWHDFIFWHGSHFLAPLQVNGKVPSKVVCFEETAQKPRVHCPHAWFGWIKMEGHGEMDSEVDALDTMEKVNNLYITPRNHIVNLFNSCFVLWKAT